jgi:hypothetical protein
MLQTTPLFFHQSEPASGAQLAQELAACLARFLDASADERTMQRSREALERWHRLAVPT